MLLESEEVERKEVSRVFIVTLSAWQMLLMRCHPVRTRDEYGVSM